VSTQRATHAENAKQLLLARGSIHRVGSCLDS